MTGSLMGSFCHGFCVPQVSYGGEDACFISDVYGGAIGVADGVGGWQESGVNPAGPWSPLARWQCQRKGSLYLPP
jgi:hypothetical protein